MTKMLFSVVADITRFFRAYAPAGFLLAVVVTLCYVLYEVYWKSRRVTMREVWSRAVGIFLLVLYVYIVIGITILSRVESETRGASFRLFRTFRNYFNARKQIYENIIMFVPYAVLLYGLAKPFRRMWACLLMGVGSSLLIEVIQWVTRTGHFEVDDILTNTIGMFIGYMICMVIEKFYNKIKNAPQR